MERRPAISGNIGSFIHDHFLVLLLIAYAIAAVWPWLGVAAREADLIDCVVLGESVSVKLPAVLLGALLFNAGLGADASELAQIARRPQIVLFGLAMNLIVPLAFLSLAYPLLQLWHDPDEVQNLLLGLAIVAAMPIAGSSTAWSQNANGDVALSLGLVVLSTIFCPVTTPLTLAAFESFATGEYAAALHQISGQGTGTFLMFCVVLPSLGGLIVRHQIGTDRISRCKPMLKLINSVVLIFLCYANASAALPQMIAEPDWDYLAGITIVVAALCLSAFLAGWLLARVFKLGRSQQRSLMFGLGMNNNGTGMVLACTTLSTMPCALLPVLACNLIQHLVAGSVNRHLR